MRHFNYLNENETESFFYIKPSFYSRNEDSSKLSYALGATLYMPATRKDIVDQLKAKKHKGLMSMVICTEDSIGDKMVLEAEETLVSNLMSLQEAIKSGELEYEDIPLIFIRVRNPQHLKKIFSISGEFSFNIKSSFISIGSVFRIATSVRLIFSFSICTSSSLTPSKTST